METKVYEYNNIKYRVSASKEIHTRLNSDDAFAATFFQQRTTKHATFIGSSQNEEDPASAPQDHQEYTTESSSTVFPKYKWTAEMTRRLIALYKEKKNKANDPKVRKKSVFADIAITMKSEGYDVDFNDVDRKWRNMKGSFFTILSSNKSEHTKWPYFNELYPLFVNENEEHPSLPVHFLSEGDGGRLGGEGPSFFTVDTIDGKHRVSASNSAKEVKGSEVKKPAKKNLLHRTSRLHSKLTTNDQVLLKLKMIHRHKLNLLKLQVKRNKYLKVISEEMKKSNEESKKRNELMRKFLNLYLSTCVFT